MENQDRIVFLPRGKRKKIAKCRRLCWLLGKCLIIDWSHFPPCIRFFHRCDRFKSFNRFNEQQHSGFWSDDGYYLKGGVCLKYWQSYGIINLSGITKLSNCLRSQWFLGQRTTTQQGAGVKPRSPQPLPALQSVALAPHEGLGLEDLEGHLDLEPGSSVGRAHYSLHLPNLCRHLRPPSLSSCLGSPANK